MKKLNITLISCFNFVFITAGSFAPISIKNGDTVIHNSSNKTLEISITQKTTCAQQMVLKDSRTISREDLLAKRHNLGKAAGKTIEVDTKQKSVRVKPNGEYAWYFVPNNKKLSAYCSLEVTLDILEKGKVVFSYKLDHPGMYYISYDQEKNSYFINEVMA